MVKKVISGGQTGADQAGLIAAFNLGIPTGGWMPRGYLTERGHEYRIAETYGLKQHHSKGYPGRTLQNIIDSDATIIFGHQDSSGSKLTKRLCAERNKPFLAIPASLYPDQAREIFAIRQWLKHIDPEVLNVAGNRESMLPGIGKWVTDILTGALAP